MFCRNGSKHIHSIWKELLDHGVNPYLTGNKRDDIFGYGKNVMSFVIRFGQGLDLTFLAGDYNIRIDRNVIKQVHQRGLFMRGWLNEPLVYQCVHLACFAYFIGCLGYSEVCCALFKKYLSNVPCMVQSPPECIPGYRHMVEYSKTPLKSLHELCRTKDHVCMTEEVKIVNDLCAVAGAEGSQYTW